MCLQYRPYFLTRRYPPQNTLILVLEWQVLDLLLIHMYYWCFGVLSVSGYEAASGPNSFYTSGTIQGATLQWQTLFNHPRHD